MPASLRLADIQMRDPFLVTAVDEQAYYLIGSTDADIWNPPGTGFDCYRSTDLETWEGPIEAFRPPAGFWADRNFWAPEVHRYRGRWYMFASFKAEGMARGTQVLVADRVSGPYRPWSDGAVTPREWECLDGTLHVADDGQPWMVYCHEWAQVLDGEMVAQRMLPDLTGLAGEPLVLFRASEAPWSRPQVHPELGIRGQVTDGPFLHRLASGELTMLWSSHGDQGYAMGVARSLSGRIEGPWEQEADPLWARDGGHGMVAQTLDGDLLLTLHRPNQTPFERPVLYPLEETGGSLALRIETPVGVDLSRAVP